MSADAITEKILNSAKEKGEKSLDDARERRDRILEDRTRSLRSEIDTKRENDKKHLVEEIQQKISTLRMDEKSKTHNLKRKKVDITYQRVWEKIQDKVVKKQLIEKDLSAYAIKNDTIIVPSSDADFFTEVFKNQIEAKNLKISKEKTKFVLGFVIPRGNIRLNCSLDEKFKQIKAETEIDVAKILFPEH